MFEFIIGLMFGAAGLYIYHIWVLDRMDTRSFEEEALLIKTGAEWANIKPTNKKANKKTNKNKKKK